MSKEYTAKLDDIYCKVVPVESTEMYEELTTKCASSTFQIPDDTLEYIKAGSNSPVVDGRPRMLHVTAFIVHEGFNNNRDGFIATELQEIVTAKNLFQGPYAGMIDVKHDHSPIGVWYDAELQRNPSNGLLGILAHGAIWAWRFPEITDAILAQQHRDGFVRVSMSALAKTSDLEFVKEGGISSTILHNPVFLGATMLIDESPGDSHATGFTDEDPQNMMDKDARVNKILTEKVASEHNVPKEEPIMLDELKPILSQELGDNADRVINQVTDVINTSLDGVKADLAARDASLEEANEKISGLEARIAELETQAEEASVALKAAGEEKTALSEKITTLEGELEEFRIAEAARVLKEVREARLAEVDEAVRKALLEKDEEVSERIISSWANMTEEEWEARKEEFSLVTEASASTNSSNKEDNGVTSLLPGTTGTSGNSFETFLKN